MRLNSLNTDLACRDFSQRSRETEWLDQANLDPEELRRVLRDLARFNGAMLGHLPVLRWLRKAVTSVAENRPLKLLDAGCGYGDLLRAIRSWADRYGITIALRGVDINAQAVRSARDATDPSYAIDYQVADIFRLQSTEPVDLIVSSLFTHHLTNDEIVNFLAWMERTASRGWLICDLQRHPVPHFFYWPRRQALSTASGGFSRRADFGPPCPDPLGVGKATLRGGNPLRRGDDPILSVPLRDRAITVRSVDVVVVGGGPAGASTACGLAIGGREVVLIERSLGAHHKVCGEFISPETQGHLAHLGVDLSSRRSTDR
jgi:SAM-dependent methyltransferase